MLANFVDKEMPDAVHKYLAYPQSFEYNLEGLKGILDFPEEAQTRFSTSTQRTKRQGANIEGGVEEKGSWELKWRKNIQLLRDTFSESAKSLVYCCQGGETSSNGKVGSHIQEE